MFAWTYRLWLPAVAAIFFVPTLLHAALSPQTDASVPDKTVWLTGQLLVASPALRQSIFDHAVILLAQHSPEGALGLIINRPAAPRPIAGLLAAMGRDASGVTESVRVFVGGPVSPQIGFVLHSADYRQSDTLDIDGRVAMSGVGDVLRDIALGKGPRKSLVAFGYSGWSPGQLEDEIKHDAWVTVPEDPALVFDDDRAQVWSDALARHKTPR